MRPKITLLLFSLIAYVFTNAQNVGIGTNTPNAGAALDISSTTGSLLIPRMTTTQRDALTPTAGMMIQNTTLNAMQAYSTFNPGGSVAIDQSHTISSTGGCANAIAQSFTAGASGSLSSVTVLIDGGSGAATLNIRSGAGVSGEIIYSQAINITAAAGVEQEFTLSTPPVVTSGSVYTIECTQPSCTMGFRYTITNTYAAGQLYISGIAQPGDLYFKTKVMTLPSGGWKTLLAGNSTNVPGTGTLLPTGNAAGNTLYWNGTSWVNNSSNIFNNGSNVGIGNTSPAAKLDITGTIKIVDGSQGTGKVLTSDANGLASWILPPSGGIGAGSAAGNTIFWNGTSWTTNSSNIFNNGGNVGIGTTTPSEKLSVLGSVHIDGTSSINTTAFTGLRSQYYQSSGEGALMSSYTTGQGYLTFYTKASSSALTQKMIIDPDGDVGIGTGSPAAKLDVVGKIRMADGTQAAGKVLTSDANGLASWVTPAGGLASGTSAGNTPYWNGTSWVVNSSNIFNNGGNVGIGTNGPGAKLHILATGGNTGLKITSGNDNDVSFLSIGRASDYAQIGACTNGTFFQDAIAGDMAIKNLNTGRILLGASLNSTAAMAIIPGGNVGIGTSAPAYKLTIGGGATDVLGVDNGASFMSKNSSGTYEQFLLPRWTDNRTILTYGTGGLQLRNNAFTTAMTLTDALNVGIGTGAPGAKLEVAGQVKITGGTPGAGKVLTSDANGLASWVTPTSGGLASGSAAGNTPYWNGTSWVVNSSNIFNNGGNIGIGTTSPLEMLHLKNGDLLLENGMQRFMVNGVPKWDIYGSSTDYSISRAGIDFPFSINFTSGNVGIGTTSPGAKLEVAGQVKITGGTPGTGKVLTSDASGLASWVTPTSGGLASGSAAGNTPYWNGTSWVVNSSNIYNNGGNVGVGTVSPNEKLDVVNNGTNGVISVKNTNTAGYSTLRFDDNTGTQRLGIGFANPSALFNAGKPFINTPSDPLILMTSDIERMRISSTGNVGIGTSSPDVNLSVESTGTSGYAGQIKLNAPNVAVASGTVISQGKSTTSKNQAEWRFDYAGNGSDNNTQSFGFTGVQPFVAFTAGQRVGIGTSTPGGQFELSLDQGRKPSTSTWTITSDERLKTIDGSYSKGLSEILQLNPIAYHYKNSPDKQFDAKTLATQAVGFSAQDVQKVFPEAVGKDADGYLNLNIHAILIAQVNAIKELKKENDELKTIINQIKQKLDMEDKAIKTGNK